MIEITLEKKLASLDKQRCNDLAHDRSITADTSGTRY